MDVLSNALPAVDHVQLRLLAEPAELMDELAEQRDWRFAQVVHFGPIFVLATTDHGHQHREEAERPLADVHPSYRYLQPALH